MENPVEKHLLDQLKKLKEKYAVMGQDLSSYLDGLLYSDYLTYWDYVHLDTLLSLQNPKTHFPDERIFITYHQITELYFSLILWEIEQISKAEQGTAEVMISRLDRMNRYFRHLESSFEIMTEGMERDQFLKFRMALLPASGFQSIQYRFIEVTSTDLINLVSQDDRVSLEVEENIDKVLEHLYWRRGATELASGRKTLTLEQFEAKYGNALRDRSIEYRRKNLLRIYQNNFKGNAEVEQGLRQFDTNANVLWPLAHLKSAGRYLQKDVAAIKATGGTNWQKYLPPKFQRIMFFPELWSEEEKNNWGKAAFSEEKV